MSINLANVKVSFFDRLNAYKDLINKKDVDPEELAQARLNLIREAKAAIEDKSSTEAIAWYGESLLYGHDGFPINVEQGIRYLKEAVIMRNLGALNTLGDAYSGVISHVPSSMHDFEKAVDFYTRSAEKNSGYASFRLAEIYGGHGPLKKDIRKALDYVERSALHQGDDNGKCLMALWMYDGTLMQRDDKRAYELFNEVYTSEFKKVEQGATASHVMVCCMFYIGMLSLFGENVERNEAQGYDFIQTAASYGRDEALEWLRNNPVPPEHQKQ